MYWQIQVFVFEGRRKGGVSGPKGRFNGSVQFAVAEAPPSKTRMEFRLLLQS